MSVQTNEIAAPRIDWSGRAPGAVARPPQPSRRVGPVRLLDADPDLATGLSPADGAAATHAVIVAGVRLSPGPWQPPHKLGATVGCLVLEGMLICDRKTFRMPDAQLFGPGDLFDVRVLCAVGGGWQVLAPTRIALIDQRVMQAARRWPALLANIAARLFEGQDEQHRLAAIRSLPRVDQRLLALFSHLGQRWGTVTTDGIAIEMPATHELLGKIVGARRPTVTLALSSLRDQGLVRRADDRRWLVPAQSSEWAADGLPLLDDQPPPRAPTR